MITCLDSLLASNRLGMEMAAVAVADTARKRRRGICVFISEVVGESLPFALGDASLGWINSPTGTTCL